MYVTRADLSHSARPDMSRRGTGTVGRFTDRRVVVGEVSAFAHRLRLSAVRWAGWYALWE